MIKVQEPKKFIKYLFTVFFFILIFAAVSGCGASKERLEKEEAYRKIGLNAMEKEDYNAAIESFNSALDQARSLGKNEVDICYYKAAAQFASGDLTGAIETYDALLEYDKKNADAWFLRGCVYLKNNDIQKAMEDFNNAKKYASDHEMYLHIYHSLVGAGLKEDAEEYLTEALEKKTGRTGRNYTVKGQIYLLKDDLPSAQEQLEKAVEKGDMEAELYLAQVYQRQGKQEEAAECIDAYVEKYPDSSVAYNQNGLKQMEQGNYQEALKFFQEGLQLQKVTNEQELRSNQIAAYEYLGDYETARKEMKRYLSDYPEDEKAAREYVFLGKNREEPEAENEKSQEPKTENVTEEQETESQETDPKVQEAQGKEEG